MTTQNLSITFTVLCIGLDNAGKTTICRNLSNSNRMEVFPTACMEIHYVNCPKVNKPCLIYDLSGSGRHRDQWKLFFSEVQAILYVIDASDSEDRYKLQKMLIESIMTDEVIQKMQQPFFFLFNKQDKENTYDKDELIKDLGLDSKKYKNKQIYKETSGFTGQSLKDVIDQLTDLILSKKS